MLTNKIITANDFFNRIGSWEAYKSLNIIPAMAKKGIEPQGYAPDKPLEAYINHGKWLVKCECGGCEKVWEEGWVMCQSCFNALSGHKFRPTVFPKKRKDIEALLSLRRLPNRNWLPGETLLFLKAENEAHKAELLEVN